MNRTAPSGKPQPGFVESAPKYIASITTTNIGVGAPEISFSLVEPQRDMRISRLSTGGSVVGGSAGTQWAMAIYDAAGNLLGQTVDSGDLGGGAGEYELPMVKPVKLEAGKQYWLAVLGEVDGGPPLALWHPTAGAGNNGATGAFLISPPSYAFPESVAVAPTPAPFNYMRASE